MTLRVRFFTFKRFLEFKSVLLFPVISPSYKRTDLPREISVRKCVGHEMNTHEIVHLCI